MNSILQESVFFGFALTLAAYWIGMEICKRFPFPLWNPLIISMAIIMVFLAVGKIEVATYNLGADYLKYFLTPSTVCLAVPLYRKMQVLKENLWAILAGVVSGCVTSGVSILILCKLCHMDELLYISILPKSITTAMALGVAEKIGAMSSVTIIGIIVAGITGSILSPLMFKIFRIKDPVAQGIAIGTCSHALGTTKAIELGEIQGAMSGLAIVVAGIITVIVVPIMVPFW